MGLLVGAAALPMHWRQRLRVGITGAALTNLLMTLGHEWSDVCAHALGGVACSLAACAALDGDRAHARRTTIALLLAGSVAGPVLGLASIAALGPFVNPRWLYAAAAMLAMVIAVWLSYRLTDSPSGSSPARRFTPPALATLLVGIAWSAAFMVFVAQSSVNREQALRLMVVQIPGFLLLGRGGYWARTAMAVALVLVGILRFGNLTLPGAMAGWPSPSFLTWAGAACMAGAFSASGNCRGMSSTRVVTGCAVGILITLSAVAVAGSLSPQAPGPVALCAMVLAVIVLLTLPAVMSIRAR
jgi:hypothetical protein